MNLLIIDKKYVGFISNRLRNFRYKGNGLSSFTHDCERHDSHKRRAYFIEGKSNGLFMKCHHCGVCLSFAHFLRDIDTILYQEYRMECFKEGIYKTNPEEPQKAVLPEPEDVSPLAKYLPGLIPYSTLADNNGAVKYLMKRMLPRDKINQLYVAPKFFKWASQFESVFANRTDEHPRLVIPYTTKDGGVLGFTCRSFGSEEPKYIQLRLDKDKEFLYGLDKVDYTKPILALEGHIDSMFLDNAIAVGNANYGAQFLKDHKDQIIIVPDNDFRRNPEVCKQLRRAIDDGFSVCLLPSKWPKDINDIVKSGISPTEIMHYIQNHTKKDIAARLEFTLEKRC